MIHLGLPVELFLLGEITVEDCAELINDILEFNIRMDIINDR